jgi:catechol 2,3-dioxygenase-like lactoylglutathione lyase family enzyme
MITKLTHVTIWVKNQDEAKAFYVGKLGFQVRTDDSSTLPGYRWLTVAPSDQPEIEIILGPAVQPEEIAAIGKQGTWVLGSDDIYKDYADLKLRGVKIHGEPQVNPYGTDFVFADLYGNTFDLVQTPKQ